MIIVINVSVDEESPNSTKIDVGAEPRRADPIKSFRLPLILDPALF